MKKPRPARKAAQPMWFCSVLSCLFLYYKNMLRSVGRKKKAWKTMEDNLEWYAIITVYYQGRFHFACSTLTTIGTTGTWVCSWNWQCLVGYHFIETDCFHFCLSQSFGPDYICSPTWLRLRLLTKTQFHPLLSFCFGHVQYLRCSRRDSLPTCQIRYRTSTFSKGALIDTTYSRPGKRMERKIE